MYKRREFHVLHGEGDDSSSSDSDDSAGADVAGAFGTRRIRPLALICTRCLAEEESDSEPEEPVGRVRGRLGASCAGVAAAHD